MFERGHLRAESALPGAADATERESALGQPLVRVVGAQPQTVLGPAGEHAVGLGDAASDQVVNHHPDVGLGPVEPEVGPAAAGQQGGVESGEQALGRRFFVAGGAVDLTGQEQPGDPARLQAAVEGARVDVVVLDRIARLQHDRPLEPRDLPQHRRLDRAGQGGRDAVGVDRRVVQPLRLKEDLVPLAPGETHHLVLDRWAVARAAALDLPGVDRRPMQVGADQVVDPWVRIGDMAVDLRCRDRLGQHREGLRRLVSRLPLEPGMIDGPAVEARRRARLQAAEREAEGFEGFRQTDRRRLADPARRPGLLADVDHPAQEGPGRHHDGAGRERLARRAADPRAPALGVGHDVLDRRRPHLQVRLLAQQVLHRRAEETAVRLGARPPHRGSLAPVEHAELDAGAIDGAAHDSVQGIDLADQMSLAQAADRRVARHDADGVDPMGRQQRPGAQARRGGRRLAARVSSPHHDYVEVAHGRRHRSCRNQSQKPGPCFT